MGNPRIFGSAARGEDNEQSDLDILIDATDRHPARNKRRRELGGRSSLASQPAVSVFMGSTTTEIFSVRSQVEHSKVRSSNPRSPGETRPKAILCLHTGHIGRSAIELPINTYPRRS